MTEQNSTATEPGCYINGHHGIYAIDLLADIYESYHPGWKDTTVGDEILRIIRHHLHGDVGAFITLDDGHQLSQHDATDIVLSELYDELTDGLPTADGYCWYWQDGELFYGLIAELEEVPA